MPVSHAATGTMHYADQGSALRVMLVLANLRRVLVIFNGVRSHHGQRALLGYHYRREGLPP
jgi:hypothetical protein